MTAASPTVAATDVSDKEVLDSESRMPQNGGPDAQSGAKGMAKARPGTLKRLLKYIFHYKVRMVFIILSIIVSAVAQAGAALFLQSLIDRYILPLVGKPNPVWTPLIEALILMGILYALGTLCSWLYNYLLVGVEQGVMKTIRDEMFEHMQTLSISFFDTHEHGDLMSRYTNDTDTLRQAISQSLPQMFASGITALAALISMFWLSVPYTVFVLVFTALLLLLIQVLVSRSGRYFVKQQQELGDVNAFVEEAVAAGGVRLTPVSGAGLRTFVPKDACEAVTGATGATPFREWKYWFDDVPAPDDGLRTIGDDPGTERGDAPAAHRG